MTEATISGKDLIATLNNISLRTEGTGPSRRIVVYIDAGLVEVPIISEPANGEIGHFVNGDHIVDIIRKAPIR